MYYLEPGNQPCAHLLIARHDCRLQQNSDYVAECCLFVSASELMSSQQGASTGYIGDGSCEIAACSVLELRILS